MVYHPCGVPRGFIVGVFNGEGPPVPIPNTEVKLTSAEDTWREAAWKNRSSPAQRIAVPAGAAIHSYSSLAQSVEHAAVNRRVVGSSPTGGARKDNIFFEDVVLFLFTMNCCKASDGKTHDSGAMYFGLSALLLLLFCEGTIFAAGKRALCCCNATRS